MDSVLSFLLSVNKISLAAFVGVLGFLVYEISLLRKEQLKKQKPSIPQFNTATVIDKKILQQQAATAVPVKKVASSKQTKASPMLIIILVIAILLFAGFSVYMIFMNKEQKKTEAGVPQIVTNEISSPGLKVFDQNWNVIPDAQSNSLLLKGGRVYIGIQTISEADIDRARIKVNQKDWNIRDITEKFNSSKNVYFIEYNVASGSPQLKIDAQLHSSTDGWLGD